MSSARGHKEGVGLHARLDVAPNHSVLDEKVHVRMRKPACILERCFKGALV